MIPSIYKAFETETSFLAIMPRPAPGEWLEEELTWLKDFGVNCLVSMLEKPEEEDLILSHEQELAESLGMAFVSFPVSDRCVPNDAPSFAAFVHSLAHRLSSGENVAVHCRAGIGRSGLTVAAVMVALGVGPDVVFSRISEARGVIVPDTMEQAQWFERHYPSFQFEA